MKIPFSKKFWQELYKKYVHIGGEFLCFADDSFCAYWDEPESKQKIINISKQFLKEKYPTKFAAWQSKGHCLFSISDYYQGIQIRTDFLEWILKKRKTSFLDNQL